MLELALYHPELGFYSRPDAGAGRGRDFLTSPELGPLFGRVVARALDTWWQQLGRPDPFFVVEAGAGAGTLAASVLAAAPDCSAAMRYVLVERSAALRERYAARLAIEPARQALGPTLVPEHGEAPEPTPGSGPLVTSLAELPAGPLVGVVLANELLDNLPFRLLQQGRDRGWLEVRVGEDLAEVLVPASPAFSALAAELAPDAPGDGRIPLQKQASEWLREALALLRRGRVVAFDYAGTTPEMARRPWTEWVRTYRGHARGAPPLIDLGQQDVTCEVAVDQLAAVHPLAGDRPQAEFLRAHGLDQLAAEARRTWEARAAIGDLAAVKARSALAEAAALTDQRGLGGFHVLEWAK